MPVIEANTSIGQLKDLVGMGPVRYDYIVRGVVTSSDSMGNFYKQLFIEDTSGAIELRLGVYDLFSMYQRWDIVSVRLSGMSLGSYCNSIQFGYGKRGLTYIDPITSYDIIEEFVIPQPGSDVNVGTKVEIEDINESLAGRLVLIEGYFVNAQYDGMNQIYEGKQPFSDGQRTVNVVTSSYAGFSKQLLPSSTVTLRAIVTFDIHNNIELKLCDLTDVMPLL